MPGKPGVGHDTTLQDLAVNVDDSKVISGQISNRGVRVTFKEFSTLELRGRNTREYRVYRKIRGCQSVELKIRRLCLFSGLHYSTRPLYKLLVNVKEDLSDEDQYGLDIHSYCHYGGLGLRS